MAFLKIVCMLFVTVMLFDYVSTKYVFLLDAMNTQTHEAVGTSLFGQKPRSMLFPTGKSSGIILEESRLIMGSALVFQTQ